jgi:RNA polymerase sigma-70 factor (ECF subfamily)
MLTFNPPPDEEARLLAAARGDPAQFAPLYERYFDRIYAYCRYRVGEPEAEDVTSQVFIRALSGIAGYRGGSVRAWLFRIAHNCVVDHQRARRPQVSLDRDEIDLPAPGNDLADHLFHEEQLQALRTVVADLEDDEVHLLTLKLVSGLNASEIAQVTGQSAVAVRVALHRLLKRLRQRYERVMETER